MIDRAKIIKGLESLRNICNAKSNMAIGNGKAAWAGYANTADDALALLKEQDERGKAICKEICYFICGSCSTDTDADKEYVCHVVQQIFIKGWR